MPGRDRVTDPVGGERAYPGAAMNAPTSADAPTWVVVQAETTGLAPQQHRILEIAVVVLDERGTALGEATTLVNPGMAIDANARHGIRDEDVAGAPSFDEIAGWLIRWLAGKVVVGHNLLFTVAFLEEEFHRAGVEMPHVPGICTRTHAPRYLSELAGRSLAQCCAAAGVPMPGPRSALGDARAAGALFANFLERRPDLPSQWRDFITRARRMEWPDLPMRHFVMAPRPMAFPPTAEPPPADEEPSERTGEVPVALNGGAPRAADAELPAERDARIPRYLTDLEPAKARPRRREVVLPEGVESFTDAVRLKDIGAALTHFEAERVAAHREMLRELDEKLKSDRRTPQAGTVADQPAEVDGSGRHSSGSPAAVEPGTVPPAAVPSDPGASTAGASAAVEPGAVPSAAVPSAAGTSTAVPSDAGASASTPDAAPSGVRASGFSRQDDGAEPTAPGPGTRGTATTRTGAAETDAPGARAPATDGARRSTAAMGGAASGSVSMGRIAASADANGVPVAGWYSDPRGDGTRLRWWDGTAWTNHTHG